MMNKKSRWLAAILSVMMVFCYMPSMAFASTDLADIEGFAISNDTITWDEFTSNGTDADEYDVALWSRAKGGNISDWGYTGNRITVTDEETELEDDFNLTDNREYMVVVTAVIGTDDVSAETASDDGDDNNAYYLYDEDTTGDAEVPSGVTLGDATGIWGKLTIPEGNADEYVVTLYKSKTSVDSNDDIDNAPTGAIKVTSKTIDNDDTSDDVTYKFGGVMTYASGSNQYNNYFVTITAKRAGMDDSNMYMSDSVLAVDGLADDLDKPVFDGQFNDNANDTVGIVAFTAGEGETVNNLANYDTIVLQLYKRVDGASAVKVGSTVVVDEDDDDYSDLGFSHKFKDLDEANTSYYVTAVAQAEGRGDSDTAYSSSYILDDSAVEPDSVDLDDDGMLTVTTQDAKGDEVEADSYVAQIRYNGVNAGAEFTVTTEDAAYDITTEIDAAGYDIDDDYDNLTVRVKGIADGAADSAWVTSSNSADSPDSAKWDLSSNNDPVATWKTVDDADSYKVTLYAMEDEDDDPADGLGDEIDSLYTTKTSVNLSGLLDEDDNYAYLAFKVQSVKDGAKSSATLSTTPNFEFDYKLDDVENVMWDGDKSTWDAVSGADSYSVSKMVNGKQVGPTKTVTTNEIQFKGLSKPGVYTFVVMANSTDDGVVSSTSMESDYKVIAAKQPGTFKVTKATKTKTTVKLYWSKSSNVDVYRIYKKVNGTYKVYIKSVRGTATAKTITGLKSGTAHYFKVKAVNNGLYTFSNAKKATTLK